MAYSGSKPVGGKMTRTPPTVRLALRLSVAIALIAAPVAAQAPVATEFDKLHFRSIGPATMSGRVADLAVYEANPAIFYVATAHGGVWKTTSNGALWTPLAQDKGLLSIGAVAVSQRNPDLVYIGTGESNNRQSGSWGDGMWKSTDGGKTVTNIGLPNSKHIGRIVLDPNNDQTVFVASAGPLYGPGGDRGIFKSTDGGRTWKNVLPGNQDTGANDVVISHADPRVMYAAMYQRRRTTCCMNGGGPGSGVYKSTDGGETWARLAVPGFPSGALGRVGLDVYRRSAGMIFVSVEAPGGGGRGQAAPTEGSPDAPASGGGTYRSDDGGVTWRRTSANNPRPMYFSQVRIDPNNSDRIMMGGVGLQMSADGGRLWEPDASLMIHDDLHALWINPANSDHIIQGNDGGVAISYDGAKTWSFLPNLPVGLFYHVGFDMETPYNVCGGMQDNYNWCGPSRSRHTQGIMNYDWFQIQGGDGFVAIPDVRDSRIIYTESQDGNLTRKNKITGESKSIRPTPANVVNATPGEPGYRFHWDTPLMQSPNDPGQLLVAANRVFRSTDRGDSWTAISPDLTTSANRDTIVTMGVKGSDINIARNDGISQWPAIVALAESPKQAGVFYAGTDDGNVQMSRDNGKTWTNITKRLPGFPANAFVSRVVPSRFDAATVYITVDNHRENDYGPHAWVSKDFGTTFARVTNGLNGEVTRTLTEDLKNPDVLYMGTETGIFVSLDRAQSWRRIKANFPTVRVDELTIHPRDNALLVASHGRALWILDDLSPIQEYSAAAAASTDGKVFSPSPALQWKNMDNRNDEFWGHQYFVGENPPTEAVVNIYLKRSIPGLTLRVNDASGRLVRNVAVSAAKNAAGIQSVCWDQRGEPLPVDSATAALAAQFAGGGGGRGGRGGGTPAIPGIPTPAPTAGYLPVNPCADGGGGGGGGGGGRGGGAPGAAPYVVPGTYTVQLVANNTVLDSKTLRVVGDPAVRIVGAERERYNAIANDLHVLSGRAAAAVSALNPLNRQIGDARTKVRDGASIPADIKTRFEAFYKEWEATRRKFGISDPPAFNAGGGRGGGGGGGRGGGGGGADNSDNVVAKINGARASVAAFWEMPSASTMQQINEAKTGLPRAIAEANAFISKANAMSAALKPHNITLTVPAPVK
jgi:photosystem II stability/assembly factor-like uncharacterized protein